MMTKLTRLVDVPWQYYTTTKTYWVGKCIGQYYTMTRLTGVVDVPDSTTQ